MSMFQKSFASTGYKTCRWIRKETVFYLPATSFPKKAKDGLSNVYVLSKDRKELHVKTFGKPSKDVHLCGAIFDLALLFFIIAYYGNRETFGSSKRILSTRYPYWLLYDSAPEDCIETKHLNVGRILSEVGSIVEIYFNGLQEEFKGIVSKMSIEDDTKLHSFFKKVSDLKNLEGETKAEEEMKTSKVIEMLDK
ncbi:hypothetical protein QIS74_13684 [Colletotrichum tabaci]|uniref:Uncharacterized protein n=1 Tax=Colletotrichum tabaci TaxID=1209068 RepID=A0AAV9SSL9_9PEZI